MQLVDLLFCRWALRHAHRSTPNHSYIDVGRHYETSFFVPKKYCWDFDSIEEQSQTFERFEIPKGLMLSQHNDRADGITIIDGILNEPFTMCDIAFELIF